MKSFRLIGFLQKLSNSVLETSIYLNTNKRGGFGQLLHTMYPLIFKLKDLLIPILNHCENLKITQFHKKIL